MSRIVSNKAHTEASPLRVPAVRRHEMDPLQGTEESAMSTAFRVAIGRSIRTAVQRALLAVASTLALALIVPALIMTAQTPQIRVMERHASGQTVAPIFEGWSPNPDGTRNLWFGYMNRNYEEDLD